MFDAVLLLLIWSMYLVYRDQACERKRYGSVNFNERYASFIQKSRLTLLSGTIIIYVLDIILHENIL